MRRMSGRKSERRGESRKRQIKIFVAEIHEENFSRACNSNSSRWAARRRRVEEKEKNGTTKEEFSLWTVKLKASEVLWSVTAFRVRWMHKNEQKPSEVEWIKKERKKMKKVWKEVKKKRTGAGGLVGRTRFNVRLVTFITKNCSHKFSFQATTSNLWSPLSV